MGETADPSVLLYPEDTYESRTELLLFCWTLPSLIHPLGRDTHLSSAPFSLSHALEQQCSVARAPGLSLRAPLPLPTVSVHHSPTGTPCRRPHTTGSFPFSSPCARSFPCLECLPLCSLPFQIHLHKALSNSRISPLGKLWCYFLVGNLALSCVDLYFSFCFPNCIRSTLKERTRTENLDCSVYV